MIKDYNMIIFMYSLNSYFIVKINKKGHIRNNIHIVGLTLAFYIQWKAVRP